MRYIIPGVESVFWKYVFFKYERLYIACGNLIFNVDKQHNLQRQTQNNTGSLLTAITKLYSCVNIVVVEKQYIERTLCFHSLT